MSNLESKLIKENINSENANLKVKVNPKHFPSSVREWNNSIYTFNKNSISLIPVTTLSVMKLIKSYFNFFNKELERKLRTKRLLFRLKRLSLNKIFLSNGEFKHTNNKVIINIYIYNRQKFNYLHKLNKIYISKILSKKGKRNINISILRRLNSIYLKSIKCLKEANRNKYLLIKSLNIFEKSPNFRVKNFKSLSIATEVFHKKIIRRSMKKLRMYFLYRKLLYLNKSKLNYTYLSYLKSHLENIYNKNVEFNLINLKRFYLNSDIFSDIIRLKLTRNRRKIIKSLNRMKDKVKIRKKPFLLLDYNKLYRNLMDIDMRSNDGMTTRNLVINTLKYRHVTGFRLEAKGRLTRRYTASRSLSKVRYKGNLLDIDSSFRGLSSVVLKGNLKSNIQFSKMKSKTRIGSFGIKGWISGN